MLLLRFSIAFVLTVTVTANNEWRSRTTLLRENLPDNDTVFTSETLVKRWLLLNGGAAEIPPGVRLWFKKNQSSYCVHQSTECNSHQSSQQNFKKVPEWLPIPEAAPGDQFTISLELTTPSVPGKLYLAFEMSDDQYTTGPEIWLELNVVDRLTTNSTADNSVKLELDAVKTPTEHELRQLWNTKPIPAIELQNLTHEQFMREFVDAQLPVIIRNAIPKENLDHISFERIKSVCGSHLSKTTVWSSHPQQECEWANLCNDEKSVLGFFIDEQILEPLQTTEEKSIHEMKYVHDVSLHRVCPALEPYCPIPWLFSDDLLAAWDGFADNNWPSLFLGPNGSRTNFHTDTLGSAFTMEMIKGRKQWLIAPPNFTHHLSRWNSTADMTVYIDAFDPNFTEYPLARDSPIQEGVLEEGEVMYIPGNWIHAVINRGATIGVSRNFVPTGPSLQAVVDHCSMSSNDQHHPSPNATHWPVRDRVICQLAALLLKHNFQAAPPPVSIKAYDAECSNSSCLQQQGLTGLKSKAEVNDIMVPQLKKFLDTLKEDRDRGDLDSESIKLLSSLEDCARKIHKGRRSRQWRLGSVEKAKPPKLEL